MQLPVPALPLTSHVVLSKSPHLSGPVSLPVKLEYRSICSKSLPVPNISPVQQGCPMPLKQLSHSTPPAHSFVVPFSHLSQNWGREDGGTQRGSLGASFYQIGAISKAEELTWPCSQFTGDIWGQKEWVPRRAPEERRGDEANVRPKSQRERSWTQRGRERGKCEPRCQTGRKKKLNLGVAEASIPRA